MIDRLITLQGGAKHTGDAHPKMTTKINGGRVCNNWAVPIRPRFRVHFQSLVQGGLATTSAAQPHTCTTLLQAGRLFPRLVVIDPLPN
jgi:hypothetical protein